MKKTETKINIGTCLKCILFCVLFIYLSCILISQQFKFSRLKKENAEIDAKIQAAQQEQKNLNDELSSIDSEDYIRRIIREKLGYTKSTEKVFVDASK